MEHFKRVISLLLALFIAVSLILSNCSFSFADESEEEWRQVNSHELVVASWKAYLNSRRANIFSHQTSALINWTYDKLDEECRKKGYTMQELQAGLFYIFSEQNGITGKILKFRYTASSLNIFNQLFSGIAEEYNLNTADGSTFNTSLKSGKYFEDDFGDGCYIYEISTVSIQTNINTLLNNTTVLGTGYKYDTDYFETLPIGTNAYTLEYNNGTQLTYYLNRGIVSRPSYTNDQVILSGNSEQATGASYWLYIYKNIYYETLDSRLIIVKYNNKYFLGNYIKYLDGNTEYYTLNAVVLINGLDPITANINAISDGLQAGVSALGKGAVIDALKQGANEGYNTIKGFLDDDNPDIKTKEVDDDGNDVNNNTNIGPFNVFGFINANGEINFKMPKVSDIAPNGFSIAGFLQKFPFCIPLDIYAMLDLLDAEPETPKFQTNIRFSTFQYHLDLDLSDYDTLMQFVRKLFLILYIFGILLITPYIVK